MIPALDALSIPESSSAMPIAPGIRHVRGAAIAAPVPAGMAGRGTHSRRRSR